MYFSLILPTYNRAWVLPRTLRLIREQEFADWELIVVDDGSTDGTRKIVKTITAEDRRVRYVYQKNARQSAARQNGLQQARGECVTYVDSDDEVYQNYLSTAKDFLDAHPDVWFATANCDRTLELHDKNNQLMTKVVEAPSDLPPDAMTLKSYAHWKMKPCGTGIFHRRDKVTDTITWDTNFRLFEDIDFVFQFGVEYPDHFGFIPQKIFHQRQAFGNEGICSGASYDDWANGFEQLFKKYEQAWFMQGQEWYPRKVDEYRERQRLILQGKYPSRIEKYFPEHAQLKTL